MNRAILIGRLGRDPDMRHTQDGTAVANVSLATSESWRDKNTGEKREKTEWHRVVLWGKLAEVAEKWVHKGDQIMIEGKIETRKWQDQSGQDKYTTEIRAERMEMLGSANNRGDAHEQSADSSPVGGGGSVDLDDDIPFAPEWRI